MSLFRHALRLAVLLLLATPALADDFRIGLITDMGSAFADITGRGSVVAAQMAVEDFGGSVLGRRIELRTADHQMKAAVGSAQVTEWFDRDGVAAIFGLSGSSVALAAQAIVKDRPTRALFQSEALATELAGKFCVANSVHWGADLYALGAAVTRYLTRAGTKDWFLIVQDTAAGPPAIRAGTAGIVAEGGRVLGEVRIPFNARDVASFVLQAQSANPQMVAVGFGGGDFINLVRAAQQFGLTAKAPFASLALFSPDIDAMGLELAQGITAIVPFYADMNPEARAWTARFQQRAGKLPSWSQVQDYEAVLSYLRAVQRLGTDDAGRVIPAMQGETFNLFSLAGGHIRADMQLVRPLYLFKVKTPAQSTGKGDYYDVIGTIAADDAYLPLSASDCPLLQK